MKVIRWNRLMVSDTAKRLLQTTTFLLNPSCRQKEPTGQLAQWLFFPASICRRKEKQELSGEDTSLSLTFLLFPRDSREKNAHSYSI